MFFLGNITRNKKNINVFHASSYSIPFCKTQYNSFLTTDLDWVYSYTPLPLSDETLNFR